jgi:hypothetical protein
MLTCVVPRNLSLCHIAREISSENGKLFLPKIWKPWPHGRSTAATTLALHPHLFVMHRWPYGLSFLRTLGDNEIILPSENYLGLWHKEQERYWLRKWQSLAGGNLHWRPRQSDFTFLKIAEAFPWMWLRVTRARDKDHDNSLGNSGQLTFMNPNGVPSGHAWSKLELDIFKDNQTYRKTQHHEWEPDTMNERTDKRRPTKIADAWITTRRLKHCWLPYSKKLNKFENLSEELETTKSVMHI